MRRRRLLVSLLFILVASGGGLLATILTDSSPELGLDLQGGVSVVLEPSGEASGDELDVALEIIRTRIDALGVAEPEITRQGESIVVQLPGIENRDRVLELVGTTAELRFRPVLQVVPTGAVEGDDEGGEGDESTTTTTTTTTAPDASTTTTSGDATTTTTAPEATTTSEGAVGLTEGEFAGVAQEPPATTTTAPPATTTTAPPATEDPGLPETTPREEDEADATVTLEDKDGEFLYLLGPTLATGEVVATARAEIPQGQWMISLTMRSGEEGIDTFNQAALVCNSLDPTLCPTGQLAIVLDSVVQSAPTINQPSYERDQIVIEGEFTEGEAKDLALVLRYGSLPIELTQQDVETISASLGEDSLRAGVIAGFVGLALVALYMVLYYRALGLVVIAGLLVWGSLLYTIISWLGTTQGLALTLAGVTGIIVSIGVTVDSYVVYFERLKDEVRAGRTLRTSTERAFQRAFRTILAADISSFIGAAVLWWLTIGSVRGFAFFLGLSTILDVVVAWFFTRPVVTLLSRNRLFTEAPVLGVARGLTMPGRRAGRSATATTATLSAGAGK